MQEGRDVANGGHAAVGAALPDWRGVRCRRPGERDAPLLPWGCTFDDAVRVTGATPDPIAAGRWLTLHLAPFSDHTRMIEVSLEFSDSRLTRASLTLRDHNWSPTQWVTTELTSAYGQPTERHVPQPGVLEDYETIHWRLPGLAIVHGLFSVYSGPIEDAHERIEFTAV